MEQAINKLKKLCEKDKNNNYIKAEWLGNMNIEAIVLILDYIETLPLQIEEYFEEEEWLAEHDLNALCEDEKECFKYFSTKKDVLKDIKHSILKKIKRGLDNV